MIKSHFLPALLLALFVLKADAQSYFYPFPTESRRPGSAGTPGFLDKDFSSFLGGTHNVQFLDRQHDMRTAMVQTDGKILIGGTFRLRASNVTYTIEGGQASTGTASTSNATTAQFNVIWRNLARLNADGTLDTSFVSPSAISVAVATRNPNIVFGPDGQVTSILLNQPTGDDLYQYLVGGDFLNFSHNEIGNSAPRKRFLVLRTIQANPNLTPTPGVQPRVVGNATERVNLTTSTTTTLPGNIFFPGLSTGTVVTQNLVPVGTIVFQSDNGLTYRKVSATGTPSDSDWVVLPIPSEPLVRLTDNVADGDGFNSPVRKLRRLFGSTVRPEFPVADTPARLAGPFDIGDIVLQLDNQFIYQKVSGPQRNSSNEDWINLPGGRQILFFATGDFTAFANDSDQRYITRFILNASGITLPVSAGISWTPPKPNRRVWDVAAINDRIFFVGEFDRVVDVNSTAGEGVVAFSKIASIDENGILDTRFNPGTGFNNTAMSIVADPIQDNLVVAGYFTEFDGFPVGRIARIEKDGSIDPAFPAPNEGNFSGANGPVRCVTRQPDGRLLIAGEFTAYNGVRRAGLARLEADGSLDLTFSPPGNASGIQNFAFDIDGGPATASLFARAIAVGNFSKLFGSNFTGVARFIGGSLPVIWYQPSQIPDPSRPSGSSSPFSVALGEDITLSVVATDNFSGFPGTNPPFEPPQAPSEPLLYQWQKNGKNIEGQVLPYLSIERAAMTDLASYRVWVWNSQFGVLSDPVRLTLRNPFIDIIPPQGLRLEGLIAPNSVLGDLGGMISLQMTRTGFVTGTITLGESSGSPTRLRVRAQYNFDTGLSLEIPVPNRSPLRLNLTTTLSRGQQVFEFTGQGNFLSDTFGNEAAITASNIVWSKANPATAFAGKYAIALETNPADLGEMVGNGPGEIPKMPQGFGLLTMQVNDVNGQARIAGTLSDGTKVTASGFIRADQESSIPVWIPLYKSLGALAGQLGIQPNGTTNPVQAQLLWSRPADMPAKAPNEGFLNVQLTATPSSGKLDPKALETISAFTLGLSDELWAGLYGAMEFPINQPLLVSGGKITPELPNDNKVSFRVNTSSGLATGSFENTDPNGAKRKVNFQAIMTSATGSPQFYGFFIMPNLVKNPDYWIGGSVTGF